MAVLELLTAHTPAIDLLRWIEFTDSVVSAASILWPTAVRSGLVLWT